jgi:competence protein ComEC
MKAIVNFFKKAAETSNKKYLFLIIFIISISYLSFYIYKFEHKEGLLKVYFLSSSRARSIFIITPDKKRILIGLGDKSTIRDITHIMPFYSRRIDYVFIPSAMQNQISGLIDIVNRYEIDKVFIPDILSTSTPLNLLLKTIDKKGIDKEYVYVDKNISIDQLKINILFPYKNFKFNKTSQPELGLEFVYKNTSLYLMGNLSKTIQEFIFKDIEPNINKNIIEVFNTGGTTKIDTILLDKVKPSFIFNTKTKPTMWVSNGEYWVKKDLY